MNLEKGLLRASSRVAAPAPSGRHRGRHSPLGLSRAAAIATSMQPLIDDLPEEIALLNEDCTILVANDAWKTSVARYRYRGLLPGGSYRGFCVGRAPTYEPAAKTLAGLDE